MPPRQEEAGVEPGEITGLLRAWRNGGDEARERLIARVHRELKKIAGALAGLELTEIAECLAVSERTVKRDWAFARAWLVRELEGGE